MAGYPTILHTEEGKAYEDMPSPWKAPITSYQRPGSLPVAGAADAQARESASPERVLAAAR